MEFTTGIEESTTDAVQTDIEHGLAVAVGYKSEVGGAYAEVKYDFRSTESVSRSITNLVSSSETLKITRESPMPFALWVFVMDIRGHKLTTPEYMFTVGRDDPNKDTSNLEVLERRYAGKK